MYVSEALRVVFLAVPRTGSRAVAQWLKAEAGAVQVARNAPPRGHHSVDARLVREYREQGFDVIATVRNPFDSLVSWWHHNGAGIDFETYVRFWPEHEWNEYTVDGSLFGLWTRHTFWRPLRYETLEASLAARLGVSVSLPQVGASDRGPYADYYTPELRAYVEETWKDELEAHGYHFEGTP